MKILSSIVERLEFTPVDDLERLELKIAQRADDLSKGDGPDSPSALEHWLRAEREILGDFER
jgi:hypothetical protein